MPADRAGQPGLAALREQVLLDWASQSLHRLADADSTSQDIHASRTHLLIGATVEQLDAASRTPPRCDRAAVSDEPGHEPGCPEAPVPMTLSDAVDRALAVGRGGHADLAPSNISAGTSLSSGAAPAVVRRDPRDRRAGPRPGRPGRPP